MKLMRLGFAWLAVALVGFNAPAEAGPIIFTSEAAYLAAITPNFQVNVGLDASGNPHGSTSQVLGTDIFSIGNNVDFSSPNGLNPTLVTVSSAHPELGPTGPTGNDWDGALQMDFGTVSSAVGFGLHDLQTFTLKLYLGGVLQSTTAVDAGTASGFVGIQELLGFDALIIDTSDNFWSLDGGSIGSQLVGQTAAASVPDGGSALALLGLGMIGLSTFRRKLF